MGVQIITGDCRDVLRTMPDESVHCVVTSPPYFGLRDYGVDGQIGLEQTPDAFVAEMVAVFRDARRVLRDDGTLWLNLGDSYASASKGTGGKTAKQATNAGAFYASRKFRHDVKDKDLLGIPWRVAFALQADGWYLRQDIIWAKPNPMPESVQDRCTKAHEYLFMLTKSPRYYYDIDAIKEPASEVSLARSERADLRNKDGWAEAYHGNPPRGFKRDKQRGHGRRHAGFNDRWDAMGREEMCSALRNKRSVWTVATQPFSEAHFATFPPALIEPCIKAGCPKDGTVLDPFGGAGTTGLVASRLGRNAVLIELNPEYVQIAKRRLENDAGMFAEVAA
jgi:DNA modification methylase